MKNSKDLNQTQYWASIEDPKELLDHLDHKIRNYYDDLRAVGLINIWERSYRAYYGGRVGSYTDNSPLFESSRINPGGKQGEKSRLKANHYRNLIRHLHQLVTQQKPNVQARASNTDYKSQSQTILANGLIDYYWREKNVGNIIRDAAEQSLIYGESFIHAPWDPTAGEIYTVDANNMPVYEGDQKYELFSPMNVIRDPSLRNNKNSEWIITKSIENRWNLCTKYPNYAEDILKADCDDPNDEESPQFQIRGGNDPDNQDNLCIYILYHRKTDALKQGRMVIFLKDLVLFDSALPYKNIPVFRMASDQLFDTIYGYSMAFDLLGVQEGIDEMHTTLMSNNKTFGIQSIWIKDTDKMHVSNLGQGMKLFKSEEPPTPIQLTKSAPESYQYLDKLEQTAEILSGISSTVRGNPEASLKSGNALALVVSQSIQFANSVQEALNRTVEEVGTGLIDNLREFAQTERVANIIGESQRPFAKSFEATDLSEINRIVVDEVNPLSKTVAGRAEIANNLLQQGMIKDPEQYLMVLATGSLDPITENSNTEMLLIRAENEDMRDGKQVHAVMTDNHALHIREHKAVLNSPEARMNPELVMNVLSHIQEHINLARMMDPALAQILGQLPLPPAGMPGQPTDPNAPQPNGPQPGQKQTSMPNVPPGSPPEAQQALEQVPTPPGVQP